MRDFPDALSAHLGGEALTTCACWQIERSDGVVMGFTDHDEPLIFDGIVHEALGGMGASDIENQAGLSPVNGEIAGALSSDRIRDEDIANGLYDDAKLRHFLVNWQDVQARSLMDTFVIASIKREEGAFRADIKSIAALADRVACRRFLPRCSASLGDHRCGIDLTPHQADAILQQVAADGSLQLALAEANADGWPDGSPDGWYAQGYAAITDAQGREQRRKILADRVIDTGIRAIELWEPFVETLQTGSTVRLVTGCDKRFSTCRDKFQNQVRFRGFPHMPSPEFIGTYASNASAMDGGALIKGSQ